MGLTATGYYEQQTMDIPGDREVWGPQRSGLVEGISNDRRTLQRGES